MSIQPWGSTGVGRRRSLLIPGLALLSLLIASCGSAGGDSTAKAPEQATPASPPSPADATQSAKEYTFAQKDQFIAMLKDQMSALKQDIATLSDKIDKSSDAAKSDAQPKLQALRDQEAKLEQASDRAVGATESTWNDVKSEASAQIDELKKGVDDVRRWITEKTTQ
jgi:hypothetical protein